MFTDTYRREEHTADSFYLVYFLLHVITFLFQMKMFSLIIKEHVQRTTEEQCGSQKK